MAPVADSRALDMAERPDLDAVADGDTGAEDDEGADRARRGRCLVSALRNTVSGAVRVDAALHRRAAQAPLHQRLGGGELGAAS